MADWGIYIALGVTIAGMFVLDLHRRETHARGYRLALQHFVEEFCYQRRKRPIDEIDPIEVANKLRNEVRNG